MATAPLLELHIHLANGNTHRFVQHDARDVEQIVRQLSPRLFDGSNLSIVGRDVVATYPGSGISGISLIMDPLPAALEQMVAVPQSAVLEVREITRESYLQRRGNARPIVAGQPFTSLNEVEFASTHRLWLETRVRAAVAGVQERQILQHIFTGPALTCRRQEALGGGLSLWNRAQMVSYTFCPRLEAPPNAWPADLIAT